MLARLYSAAFFAAAVFIVGGLIALIAQLLGPWFLPLVVFSLFVGVVIFIFETIASWTTE